jgi:hypothetical protein
VFGGEQQLAVFSHSVLLCVGPTSHMVVIPMDTKSLLNAQVRQFPRLGWRVLAHKPDYSLTYVA